MEFRSTFCSALLLVFMIQLLHHSANASKELYIVYMGEKKHDDPSVVTASHYDTLTTVLGSNDEAMKSIVYSYRHGFSGFAAMLTESQAEELSKSPGVVYVKPNTYHKLHTTRSWDFLGLDYSGQSSIPKKAKYGEDVIISVIDSESSGVVYVKPNTHRKVHTTRSWDDFLALNYYEQSSLPKKAKYGEDVIVGVIDSGIWPESRSFNDEGYGPVPARWKGVCQTGTEFNAASCNRKIIGARWYTGGVSEEKLENEYMSPRDLNGHGTHTASTIAGNQVRNVSHLQGGLGAGTAHGGAPRARLAIYKACWGRSKAECGDAALLAAIDHAIKDGVDVISLSVGGPREILGTLHAVARGITVVFAGGNDGPVPQTIENDVPWVITVAAATIDRAFPTVVSLGNNETLVGQSLYYNTTSRSKKFQTLVNGDSCNAESLASINVTEKVVLCSPPLDKEVPPVLFEDIFDRVARAGAKGLIFAQYTTNLLDVLDRCHGEMPCVLVDNEIARRIATFASSTGDPEVKVSKTVTMVGSGVLSPRVAAFSSRGPSTQFPAILKPDVAAPGVSILAAVGDSYQFISGTSMACPHVSAVVALLKSVHPDWSPAMIKSAIVTTASVVDRFGMPIQAEAVPRKLADPFDFGGGHIEPERAVDPGLVYDIDPREYTKFQNCTMATLDYCKSYMGQLYQLNLPSIVVPDLKDNVTVQRTVTNVGGFEATYKAVVDAPAGVNMIVEPLVIKFIKGGNRTATFKVTFVARQKVQGGYTFGSLTWLDNNTHSVRIPIALRTIIQDFVADTS
ncbi:subtilisin-like protease SBT3.9 [Oryza brachyantha]|uniref:Subtilisin-like protease n=1 Tax=Oryza brachyantha TaxID=4533 RepID=J3LBL9_ORYBR|nr:subtilisin-like protease SBT3.9 [Oryza brachyantha]